MSPEDRLVLYRCALVSGTVCHLDTIEDDAHRMLAAERPTKTNGSVAEEPTISVSHGPCAVALVMLTTRSIVIKGWVYARCGEDKFMSYVEGFEALYVSPAMSDAINTLTAVLRARYAELTREP
jgi:hypothetical protein